MNKNSKVLALKYRPQSFDDLIGQETITESIKNSIRINKTPNAYLFTGIRGVGKTTIARIVAKSLNCSEAIENQCKVKCENCDAITNSNHMDVLEMDAASKTGVDDVRDLIEFSRYGPLSSKDSASLTEPSDIFTINLSASSEALPFSFSLIILIKLNNSEDFILDKSNL